MIKALHENGALFLSQERMLRLRSARERRATENTELNSVASVVLRLLRVPFLPPFFAYFPGVVFGSASGCVRVGFAPSVSADTDGANTTPVEYESNTNTTRIDLLAEHSPFFETWVVCQVEIFAYS